MHRDVFVRHRATPKNHLGKTVFFCVLGQTALRKMQITPAAAATLYKKEMPITEITTTLKISRSTLYSYLRKEGVKK